MEQKYEYAAASIMDELPDELIPVIAGECFDVIDALRAVNGRFRRLLAVPPLLLNGAVGGDVPIYALTGIIPDLVFTRGDQTVLLQPALFGAMSYIRYVALDYIGAMTVLRDQARKYYIMAEMTRGTIVDGSFQGARYSISRMGFVRECGSNISAVFAAKPVDAVTLRAATNNVFTLEANTMLEISRENTENVYMAILVHITRVPEFAALGWDLTGKMPTWV